MPYTLQVLRLPPKFYSQLEIVHAKTSISKPRDSWGVSVRSISDLGEFHLHSKKVQHPAGLGRTAPYRSAVPALVRLTLLFVGRLHLLLRKKKKSTGKNRKWNRTNKKTQQNTHQCSYLCQKVKKHFGFFFPSNSQFFKMKPDQQQTDHTDLSLRELFSRFCIW